MIETRYSKRNKMYNIRVTVKSKMTILIFLEFCSIINDFSMHIIFYYIYTPSSSLIKITTPLSCKNNSSLMLCLLAREQDNLSRDHSKSKPQPFNQVPSDIFSLFEKSFHSDICHNKEEKTIIVSVSCPL